jgi:hypothetical protein
MTPVHALRWLALVVGCPLLWLGLLMATIAAHYRIEQDLCPSAALVSGICNDRLTGWGLWLLKHAAMVLSLVVVPAVAVALAPAHRGIAASLVLALQLAASLAISGGSRSMQVAAALGTAIAGWHIWRTGKRPVQAPNND